jgi:dihydrodiol dehydrogenase / D-xylose 1-dehydrogenase (NADP)
MTEPARWAILGAGAIATDFADALIHAELGSLHAVGARDVSRARSFAQRYRAPVAATYDEVLGRDDVDAVYVATVHPTHLELVHAALDAGKAVLCEKPLTVRAADTEAAIAHADRVGLPLVEAYKYRFGPFADRLRELLGSGRLGSIVEIESSLGFAAGSRTGRLFDPATAGGAILDVGCYPVSFAVGVVAAAGVDLGRSSVAQASGSIGSTGVDETATAVLDLGGVTARVRTSIVEETPRLSRIVGTDATLEIDNAWGSRSRSTDSAVLVDEEGRHTISVDTVQPMAAEADAVIAALREGRTQAPEIPWSQSQTIAALLDGWLDALR